MAQWFVGRSPGDVEAILGDLWREGRWRFHPRFSLQVLSGIEVACWDALGKALGVPASTFLGGRVRDHVDVMAFPQGDAPEELAREAAALAAAGHGVVYVKIGRAGRGDAEVLEAVRDAIGPEPLLRADANEAWDVPDAVDAIRALEPFGLDWVEQPVAADDIAGLAHVRRSVGVKIAVDQAVHTRAELRAVLEREAADAVVVGSHETGGLWRWRQLAALAEAHGIPLNRHACVESEISTFAALQVLAAIPNLTVGNQVMHQLLAERLTTTALEQDGGTLSVPDRPGLGFELDEDAVARARERHARQGPYLSVER
jgi:L-alanine-DL-glutamate epimerase-like enolase superfamily enzyme